MLMFSMHYFLERGYEKRAALKVYSWANEWCFVPQPRIRSAVVSCINLKTYLGWVGFSRNGVGSDVYDLKGFRHKILLLKTVGGCETVVSVWNWRKKWETAYSTEAVYEYYDWLAHNHAAMYTVHQARCLDGCITLFQLIHCLSFPPTDSSVSLDDVLKHSHLNTSGLSLFL